MARYYLPLAVQRFGDISMSGGGGGGGGGGFETPTECSRLRFETHVASPNPVVLPTIKVGDVLDVVRLNQNGVVVVAVHTQAGQQLGGIASSEVTRLRQCLDDGFVFQATVKEIKGALVKILVEPKP